MKKLLILLLCCCFLKVQATVFVSGIISTNTTWTKANSPYIVNGDLVVDSAIRLTIEPGVVVQVDSGFTFTIDGRLMAEGTTADSIIFTSSKTAPSRNAWKGITFSIKTKNDTSKIKYCLFEYASTAILSTSCNLYVFYSVLRFNTTAIHLSGTQSIYSQITQIYYNLITRNDTGFYNNRSKTGNCRFGFNNITHNNIGMRQDNTDGIFGLNGNNINYNMIGYSSDGSRDGTQGNTFIGNILYGVYVIGKGTHKDVDYISNNLIAYSPTAIYIDSAKWGSIYGNTIAYNDIGIEDNKYYRGPFPPPLTMYLNSNCYINNKVFNYRKYSSVNRTSQQDWWGTTSTASIDSTIYDFNDNSSLGKLTYTNIRTISNNCQSISSPPPCFPHPDSLIINFTSSTTATISWSAVSGAHAYEYYFIPLSSSPLSSGTITFDTYFNVTGLIPGQAYQVCVRTRCLASPFASSWICDTITMPCNAPANITANSVNMLSAIISWDSVAGVTGYEYYVAPAPSSPPATGTFTTAHSAYITGLSAGTNYVMCVRTKCISSYSTWICEGFKTWGVGIPQTPINRMVGVHPNPGTGIFTIDMPYGATSGEVIITNMYGQVVAKKSVTNADWELDLRTAAKGIYLIQIKCGEDTYRAKAVIQ